jgi:RecB family exonuclease
MRRRIEELILVFLDVELETMVEETVKGTEVRLEARAEEPDTVLVGTIDRVSRNPSGFSLIDYKKKRVPTRRDLFSDRPVSLQMPFYIYLMEQKNRSVSRAAYYSFEHKRYHFVFGGPKTNLGGPEEIRRSIDLVRKQIVTMRDRIVAGNYQIGTSDRTDCSRCGLQEICRHNYSLNR